MNTDKVTDAEVDLALQTYRKHDGMWTDSMRAALEQFLAGRQADCDEPSEAQIEAMAEAGYDADAGDQRWREVGKRTRGIWLNAMRAAFKAANLTRQELPPVGTDIPAGIGPDTVFSDTQMKRMVRAYMDAGGGGVVHGALSAAVRALFAPTKIKKWRWLVVSGEQAWVSTERYTEARATAEFCSDKTRIERIPETEITCDE